MSTSLALVAAKALPALSGSSLTYNPEKNVYLTLGYTSAAGNTYYKAIRSTFVLEENIDRCAELSNDLKKRYVGEARFLRGF